MRKIEEEEYGKKDDLALAILNKNKSRAAGADNFFDSLIDKYANAAKKPKKQAAASKTPKKKKA